MPPDTINILFNHLGLWQKENTFPSISWFLHFLNNLQSTQGCCPGCFKWNRWKKLRIPKFIKKWWFRKKILFSELWEGIHVQVFFRKERTYMNHYWSPNSWLPLFSTCYTIISYFSFFEMVFWLRLASRKLCDRRDIEI